MAYTPEQIQQAMRRAAADGNQAALADLRGRLTEAYQSQVPSATEGMSGLQKFAAGMGQGVTNIGRQIGNMVGVVSDDRLKEAAEQDRALLDTGAGRAGAFTGEVLATAPIGGLAGGAVRAGARRLGAGALKAGLTEGAIQGAVEGAITGGPDHRLSGAAWGAGGGAAMPLLGKAVQTAYRGVRPTASAKSLLRQGVDLTPGQMRPDSWVGQLEESAQHVPVVGQMIKNAREESVGDWRRVAREGGLAPGAAKDQAQSLDDVYRTFEPAYDQARGFPMSPHILNTGTNLPLATYPKNKGAFERAVFDPNIRAEDSQRIAMQKWAQSKLGSLPNKGRMGPNATLDSGDLLDLRSQVRTELREARLAKNPNRADVQMLEGIEKSLTDAFESQASDATKAALKATDRQYAQYKVLEDAYSKAGDNPMSPAHLSRAVKQATPKGGYARGEGGLMRTLAQTGKNVFDARTPPTGVRLATLLGAGGAAALSPVAAAIGGLAAIPLVTTKLGRKTMAGMTAPQRKAQELAAALRRKGSRNARRLGRSAGYATGAQAADEYNGD